MPSEFILEIAAKLVGIAEPLLEQLLPVLENDAKLLLSEAIAAAGPFVTELENSTATPSEKFATAVSQVEAFFVKAGKPILQSTVQTAVQLAVTKLRAS